MYFVNKRGLSDVVTNVLIILFVVIAISSIWIFLSPIFENTENSINKGQVCINNKVQVLNCLNVNASRMNGYRVSYRAVLGNALEVNNSILTFEFEDGSFLSENVNESMKNGDSLSKVFITSKKVKSVYILSGFLFDDGTIVYCNSDYISCINPAVLRNVSSGGYIYLGGGSGNREIIAENCVDSTVQYNCTNLKLEDCNKNIGCYIIEGASCAGLTKDVCGMYSNEGCEINEINLNCAGFGNDISACTSQLGCHVDEMGNCYGGYNAFRGCYGNRGSVCAGNPTFCIDSSNDECVLEEKFDLMEGIEVSECMNLDIPNSVYVLKNDISLLPYQNCFNISADRVSFYGNGHTINGGSEAILSEGTNNLIISNFVFNETTTSISFTNVDYSEVSGLKIYGFPTNSEGIILRFGSNNNVIRRNDFYPQEGTSGYHFIYSNDYTHYNLFESSDYNLFINNQLFSQNKWTLIQIDGGFNSFVNYTNSCGSVQKRIVPNSVFVSSINYTGYPNISISGICNKERCEIDI